MNDPIILDTCVFSDKSFLYKLEKYHGDKIIPAVAFCELYYHYLCTGKEDFILKLFSKLDIVIEEFDAVRAKNAALYSEGYGKFEENFRDYMIGSHAYPPPRKMITDNKKDFEFLKDRVLSPDELENIL